MHLGLWYPKGSSIETIVYADSDHARDYVDQKSTSGIFTFMGCCLTSWFSKNQTALAISTTKAEYELVLNPTNMTIIGTKWVFRNKLDENGVVSRNKARLVTQAYNQQERIDYDKTYAPVVRLESIRILLAYACALDFKLFQMDVKNAFLNGFINEEIYVAQPSRFIDFAKPNHVYRLKKALYELTQAPKACAKATYQTECHKCGKKGHFASDCWSKTLVPSYQSPFQPKLHYSSENKPEMKNTKDFEAKYNKVKAKLALLSSDTSATISFSSKNKGLIAESYD
nr:copia protein [Tanacetum cinerariifolium]